MILKVPTTPGRTAPAITALALATLCAWPATAAVDSSLLLLIDISGSMGDEIGNGDLQVKIDAAKAAAVSSVRRAVGKGNVEVAVLAFEGDCSRPISRHLDFTTDTAALTSFIRSLEPGRGTPMATAVSVANQHMKSRSSPSSRDQMIVLLADGANDCGDVSAVMAQLKTSGVIFRHETIGFGITAVSDAARDLRNIATQSGGTYHHAVNATQLGDLLVDFVDTMSVIDLLGTFRSKTPGSVAGQRQDPNAGQADKPPADRSSVAPSSAPKRADRASDLIGHFKPRRPPAPEVAAKDEVPNDGDSDSTLCYKQFSNPNGLEGVQDNLSLTEFMCTESCPAWRERSLVGGLALIDNVCMSIKGLDAQQMGCSSKCAYVARSGPGSCVQGWSSGGNRCVGSFDDLRPPRNVRHYYCDASDNKHQVTWEISSQPTAGFRVYINHYPDRNHEAELLGTTSGRRFDFEYGINFKDDPIVDGNNHWSPFPRAGVAACNKYGICTPVVYGEGGDCPL